MLFEGVNSTSFVIPESEAVVPAQRVTTSESIPRAGETDGSENLGQIQPAVFSQIVSEPPTNFQFSLQIYRPPEDTIAEESVSLETGDQPLPPSSFFRIDGRPAGLTVEEPHAGTLPPVGLVTVDGPPSGSVANPELSPVEELPASDVRAVQPKLFSDSGPVEPEITTPQRPEFSTTVESTNAGPEGGSRTYLESIGLEPAAGTSTRETPTQSPVTHASRAVAQTNHGSVLAPNASAHGGPAAPPQQAFAKSQSRTCMSTARVQSARPMGMSLRVRLSLSIVCRRRSGLVGNKIGRCACDCTRRSWARCR
jgi:hypothetical protein